MPIFGMQVITIWCHCNERSYILL